MLIFSSTGPGSLRITGANRAVTVYSGKSAQPGDILLQSVPAEQPQENVVCWPGEYDIAGVTIRGVGHKEGQQVSYLVVADGIRCACPSAPLQDWTDAQMEQLGDVDVLAVPDADVKIVQKFVDELDPRVLLLLPGGKGGVSEETLRACGAQEKGPVAEFKLRSLPNEGREVVVFGL